MLDETKDDFYFQNAGENKKAKIEKSGSHIRRQDPRTPPNDVKFNVESLTTEEIERKIKEQYKKIDGDWTCITCDYTSPKQYNVRKHVEKHIDGLSYISNLCYKEFRSSNSFYGHKYTAHAIQQ